ncbi:MAG: T9SS type A sorting domain-containing protein [bacterium]
MRTKLVILILLTLAGLSFAQKRFYKGNTHTHCFPRSIDVYDFSYTASRVVADYKAKGYDFLVFTDHENYWDASGLSSADFTVLSGSEIGIYGNGRWGHFTAMGIKSNILGLGKSHQQLLDAIAVRGGFAILNHPRWSTMPITAKQVINDMKQNLFHVEVYTAGVDSPTDYDTSLWDSVLTTGRLMYGVACDDSHKESDQGRVWICVYASCLHADTLLSAVRNGDFYASNGIVMEFIDCAHDKITVRSTNGTMIRFIGSEGRTLSTVTAAEATYVIQGDEGYVRAEISNTMNQTAWIQPTMVAPAMDVEHGELSGFPESNFLFQNYPNPFNSYSIIRFLLFQREVVTVKVFDVLGKEIAVLVDGWLDAGEYSVPFEADDLPTGLYFCRLTTPTFIQIRSMMLVK